MFSYNDILNGFTVIEGLDGAGTSTQRALLCRALENAGKAVFDTWEPTDGPIGRLIRQALRAETILDQGSIARLYAADRHEHLHGAQGIRAQLALGRQVVCDRYILSSLAYQGLYLPVEEVWELNHRFPLPARIIFIDVDLATSAARREKRGEKAELFDAASLQARVRTGYHRFLDQLAAERPEIPILRADGSQDIPTIHAVLCGFLQIPALDVR